MRSIERYSSMAVAVFAWRELDFFEGMRGQ
jgi:hypothetical protein